MTKLKHLTIFDRKSNKVFRSTQVLENYDKNRIISEIILLDENISSDVIENIRSNVAGLQELTEASKKEFQKFEDVFRILIC